MAKADLEALRTLHEELEFGEDEAQPILDAIHELERLRAEVALWRRGQQPLFPDHERTRKQDDDLRRFNQKDPT